jgi:hypothetical protein
MAVFTPEVIGPLTDAELRATAVPVSGSVTSIPSGTQDVNVTNGSIAVTGPLTDTQLRATAVPVSGTVTATGPLTDTQLRATPVAITGTVSVGAAASVATVSNVSVGTSAVTLSASNAAKTKLVVYNETGTLYVKLGTAASASSYSYKLTANSVLEFTGYTGVVTGIKASGTTSVLVTEVGI